MARSTVDNFTNEQVSQINKELYPQWSYTGGYIFASSQGNRIILIGYEDPKPQEAAQLIQKVEAGLGRKADANIYWQKIGNDREILLSSFKDGTYKNVSSSETPSVKTEMSPEPPSVESQVSQIKVAVKENPQLSQLAAEANSKAWQNLTLWIAESYCSIKGIEFEAAANSVTRLNTRHQGKTPYEQAHMLIVHKTLQAGGVELVGGVANNINDTLDQVFKGLDRININLPEIAKLSAEMVYQTASLYGFPLDSPERKQEAMLIFAVTCRGERAIESGIDWLMQDPVPNKLLKVGAKALMIYAIGNAACIYYELRAKQLNALTSEKALVQLKEQSQYYLTDAKSEEEIRNKIKEEIQTAFPPINYSKLQKFLSANQWKEADSETGNIVLQLLSQNVVDDTKTLPSDDLHMINELWINNSGGKFGFSPQKRIYFSVDQNIGEFGETVGWRGKAGLFRGFFAWKEYKKVTFNLHDAPEGHLPAFWLKIYEDYHGADRVESFVKPIFARKDWDIKR